ncbi:MAG: hypothetical protein H0X25_05325 [Acidobacteriales bacterium]|nr:hypothetical protein [Terriglobales bacterium]
MPRKNKPKAFSAVQAVKSLARERIGTPPPEKVESGRPRQKTEKHKPRLQDLMRGE